jgi:signal transduction histidine kinase
MTRTVRALAVAAVAAAGATFAASLGRAPGWVAGLAAVTAALVLALALTPDRPDAPHHRDARDTTGRRDPREPGAVDARDAGDDRRDRRRTDAADLANRRVAALLRDRVLQDLAGVGYALSHPGADNARLAAVVQENIRTLREVLLDVQPPDLTAGTLATALDDLTAGLRMAGVNCLLRVPGDLPLASGGTGLLYRAAREALRERGESLGAAREALRSVDADAAATRVEITAAAQASGVTLTVAGARTAGWTEGLRLLAAEFTEHGGTLTVGDDRLTATLPAH